MMEEASTRAVVEAFLNQSFNNVELNEFGAFMVWLPDNPVRCEIRRLDSGEVIVIVESPVLMDVPPPPREIYELICLIQRDLPFGALVVIGNPAGEIHIAVQSKLVAEQLTQASLHAAVRLVQSTAISEIERFQSLSPPIGGARVNS